MLLRASVSASLAMRVVSTTRKTIVKSRKWTQITWRLRHLVRGEDLQTKKKVFRWRWILTVKLIMMKLVADTASKVWVANSERAAKKMLNLGHSQTTILFGSIYFPIFFLIYSLKEILILYFPKTVWRKHISKIGKYISQIQFFEKYISYHFLECTTLCLTVLLGCQVIKFK